MPSNTHVQIVEELSSREADRGARASSTLQSLQAVKEKYERVTSEILINNVTFHIISFYYNIVLSL